MIYLVVMRCMPFGINLGSSAQSDGRSPWTRPVQGKCSRRRTSYSTRWLKQLQSSPRIVPGVQADVLNDWAAYFRGWHNVNDGLLSMADLSLTQELKAEVKRLEGMRDSVEGDSASAKYWKQVLDEDIEDTKRLL